MLKDTLKKWTNPLRTLNPTIKHCKICFKPIKNQIFYGILHNDSCLCNLCLEKLKPKFNSFEVDGVKGLSIYDYDNNIKAILYQFKGCYDIELSNVFLYRYKRELTMFNKGYHIVPVPSFYLDDEQRGFNHVEEIFKYINLPMIKTIKKTVPFKQASHTAKERSQIEECLKCENPNLFKDKKILIVDDVMTTGSTLKAMIKLVKSGHPKLIKILVMSKRQLN